MSEVPNGAGRELRPARRTDRMVVREVGDELVAYALDSERVTAIDAETAQVWRRLDGSTPLTDVALRSGLTPARVEAAVARLADAGLLAGELDRRRLIRLAAAGVGAGALVAISAPTALAAGSNAKITNLIASGCTGTTNGRSGKGQVTFNGTISGTGFPTGTTTINLTVVCNSQSFTGSVNVSGPSFTGTAWQVQSASGITMTGFAGASFTVTATTTGITPTRTANASSTQGCQISGGF